MLDPQQPYSLISQLEIARDNIQELRGLLTAKAYAELNHLIKNVKCEAENIRAVIDDCCEILKAEQPDIFLFFYLGQSIEQIDTYFRFQHNIHNVLETVDPVVVQLYDLGWQDLQSSWETLKNQPYVNQFYAFTYQLENQFEVYA